MFIMYSPFYFMHYLNKLSFLQTAPMQRLRKPRLPKPPSLLNQPRPQKSPRPRKLLLPRLPKLPRHLALLRRPQKPHQHLPLRLPRLPTLKLTRHHRQRVSNTSVCYIFWSDFFIVLTSLLTYCLHLCNYLYSI